MASNENELERLQTGMKLLKLINSKLKVRCYSLDLEDYNLVGDTKEFNKDAKRCKICSCLFFKLNAC